MSGEEAPAPSETPARSALDTGLQAYLEGDLPTAAEHAESALDDDGIRPLAHYLRALVLLEQGDESAAREDLLACCEDETLAGPAGRVIAGLDTLKAQHLRSERVDESQRSDAQPHAES